MSVLDEEPVIKVSWLRDLFPIVMLLISGLVWGMKLEARYDKLEAQISDHRAHAEEKLLSMDARLRQLEKDCYEAQDQR